MTNLRDSDQAQRPIRFEIQTGITRISCDIADEALEGVSRLTLPSTRGARQQSFNRYRALIHAAAELKLAAMPEGFVGLIVLSSDDLRRVKPTPGDRTYGSITR